MKALQYILVLTIGLVIGYFAFRETPKNSKEEATIIQNSLKNVSKLSVIEAEYSELFTHKNSQAYFYNLFNFDKKIVILGTIKATVNYDLHQLKYKVDTENSTLVLQSIPETNIDYAYDFKTYDLEQSTLNSFTKDELNAVQENAKEALREKVTEDQLAKKGEERFIEELKNIFVVTKALGWKIENKSDQAWINDLIN